MLMPTCLKPYPGELLYGWIVRLFRVNMYDSIEKFCAAYIPYEDRKFKMGKPVPVRLDYRFNLDHICSENEEFECFPDVRSMIAEMTPLTALFPFMTRGYQAECMEILLREHSGCKLDIPVMDSDITELHVCPDCAREDIAAYERPYLHTVHHLPGVRMCPKHHRVLMRVQIEPDDWERGLDDGSMVPVELRADETTEQRISEFMRKLYECPPDLDLNGLQAMILARMGERGYPLESPYGNLTADLQSAGYAGLFAGKTDVRVFKVLSQKKIVPEDAIALLLFLFRDYEDFREAASKVQADDTGKLAELFPGYTVHSADHWIAELECRKCGERFHIHPYALYLGAGCPKCDREADPDEVFQRQLHMLGDGAYELEEHFPGYGRPVRIRHKTCGKERSVNASELIWMEKRCYCETYLRREELQARIDRAAQAKNVYTLVEYRGGQGIGQFVTLRHEACGGEFTIGLRAFEQVPNCRCCGQGKAVVDRFGERFHELMGDEYEMVTPYQGLLKMMTVRHRTCGTTTEGYALSFLNGKRCALCTPIIPKEDMRGYVTECTGGEYRVSSIERNTITVCGPDGKELTNSVQFFIQELSLGEKSSVFNHVVKKPEISLRDAAVLYFKAKEVCEKYGVWIPEETDAAMEFAKIQYLSRQLLAEGHLFRKCPGVFSVDLDVPDETAIREIYLERRGEHIGAYYHESAAYHAGILDKKPETEYILCNDVKTDDFRNQKVGNTKFKTRAAYAEINNRNYKAIEGINLLMFSGKHPEYKKAVEDWLLENRIYISDMEPYFQYYPFMIKKIVKELFK